MVTQHKAGTRKISFWEHVALALVLAVLAALLLHGSSAPFDFEMKFKRGPEAQTNPPAALPPTAANQPKL